MFGCLEIIPPWNFIFWKHPIPIIFLVIAAPQVKLSLLYF